MPPRGEAPDIVRIVEGLDGEVRMRSELVIRFDYGKIVPWVRRVDHARVAIAGPDGLCLRTPVEVHGEELTTVSEFTLRPGERIPFVLTWFPSHEKLPDAIDPEEALNESEEFWLEWASRCGHSGEYHEEIHRSLLMLKALTYAPTGGIVAAPTTSLPEWIGGVRNWDYRYCWLRDTTLTLTAMIRRRLQRGGDRVAPMAPAGDRGRPGGRADHVRARGRAAPRGACARLAPGLRGVAPGSRRQRCLRAASARRLRRGDRRLYETRVHGAPADDNIWALVRKLLEWLEDGWRREDAGIWEVRGPNRHFTHSKVMAWVAFDRAVRAHEEFGRKGPVDRWRELRAEIKAEVLEQAWNPTSVPTCSTTAPTSSTRAFS